MSKHVVVIVGGAVAGAQAAEILADRGIDVVVIEQNVRPYGKIEDGLPRWHDKLRIAEYQHIDQAFARSNVHFVPLTKLGRDLPVEELTKQWDVSAVILASGAWRDRKLEIDGIDEYIGRGLYYQNPFIHWFNHYPEQDYRGPRCDVGDGGIVIGGGLASIDVVKALMVETIAAALRRRGLEAGPCHLEHQGCDKVLADHGLTLETLSVKPCTLYYRRSATEMPLVAYKEGATEDEKRKTEKTRQVLLDKAMRKYLFKVQDNARPVDKIVEGGRLVGLQFVRTVTEAGKIRDVPGSAFEVRGSVIISSIGSIPEPISGISMTGELYQWNRDGVFGLGNVVTGKGNINTSRRHSKEVSEKVFTYLESRPALGDETFQNIMVRVRNRQCAVGYDGHYAAWIQKHPPIDYCQSSPPL